MKPAEFTRQALLDHATNVFAERGFDSASVREITRRAETNQAAINYHFGGKGSLYLEVLKLAVSALGDASLLDEDTIERVSRDEAVRLFIRQQVTPLLKHGEIGRYLRIFAWETLAPRRSTAISSPARSCQFWTRPRVSFAASCPPAQPAPTSSLQRSGSPSRPPPSSAISTQCRNRR